MNQSLALEIMLSGQSVLLTGPAGSGKTYVLNEFIREAKADGKSIAVTATTGLAATHLGGTTIHAWSGMGIHDELPSSFYDHLPKNRIEMIEKADTLIIDEISMLHDYRLDMLNDLTKKVRNNEDQPFGGLQVILCGDFFQLPPVNRTDSKSGGFVVGSPAWQELDPTICYLSEQHRQNDQAFLDILSALRAGDIRRHHAEQLLARLNAELPGSQEVTELHTTNFNVDDINTRRLNSIPGDSLTYTMQTTGSQNYVDALKRSCLAPEELTLKKGALVMCIKNNPERKYVNGSLGIITSFKHDTNYPVVKLRSGREITIEPEAWELRDGDKKRASLTQIPLRLAWAITVHKSQGMTLDAARINLKKAFVEGMGYVALSRVRSMEALSLTGINNMALKVSSEALLIDKQLRERTELDIKKFKHLAKKAIKRSKLTTKIAKLKPSKTKSLTSSDTSMPTWTEKLTSIRQEYPQAFKPWAKSEDKLLLELFNEGKKLDEICLYLRRQPGGIIARLKKHLGEGVDLKLI